MIKFFLKTITKRDKGFTLVELLVVIVVLGILSAIGIQLIRSKVFTKAYEVDVEAANRVLTSALYFAILDGIDIDGDDGEMLAALGLYEIIDESSLYSINASNSEYIEQWSPYVILDPEYGPDNEFYLLRVRTIAAGNNEDNILAKRKWSLDTED